jgi:hypothetical protein
MLDHWIQRFIVEIRRHNCASYPLATLIQITSGIQRHLRNDFNRADIHFVLTDDVKFAEFGKSLDFRIKKLTAEGVGANRKQADHVIASDEDHMWETGVFTVDVGLSDMCFL